jgi:CBS domain-containing protein
MADPRITIVYVTSNKHKREENEVFTRHCALPDGRLVGEVFDFDIRPVPIQEILNVDLAVMVAAEVVSAYSQLKVPCIVEHAGLIFDEYRDRSYPGGLTKPMWDTLADRFVAET